jgi:catechol 2,3-dioxygenase-like lactoylglutathione lyase family enzyme
MKRRTSEPWMPAPEYARTLRGMGINLLVRDVSRAVAFQTEVLGAEVVYQDADFAVLRHHGSEWMVHGDHTFGEHPVLALTGDGAMRGVGIELRLYDCDPDTAEMRARARGHYVLAPCADKPHGLRECALVDADGYVWVPAALPGAGLHERSSGA